LSLSLHRRGVSRGVVMLVTVLSCRLRCRCSVIFVIVSSSHRCHVVAVASPLCCYCCCCHIAVSLCHHGVVMSMDGPGCHTCHTWPALGFALAHPVHPGYSPCGWPRTSYLPSLWCRVASSLCCRHRCVVVIAVLSSSLCCRHRCVVIIAVLSSSLCCRHRCVIVIAVSLSSLCRCHRCVVVIAVSLSSSSHHRCVIVIIIVSLPCCCVMLCRHHVVVIVTWSHGHHVIVTWSHGHHVIVTWSLCRCSHGCHVVVTSSLCHRRMVIVSSSSYGCCVVSCHCRIVAVITW